METYRLSWIPSDSTFVQNQQVWASVNAAAAVKLGVDLSSNVAFIDWDFPTDANVDWFVRTIGDNDTTADSAHDVFMAANEETVQPAYDLAHMWVAHKV